MASRRLQKEFGVITGTPPDWLKVELIGDNMYKWKVKMQGPEKSPYEKGTFVLNVDIPQEYPFKPPKITFITKVYHPNVKSDGSICSEVLLSDGWSPQLRINEVLMTIRHLLKEPNPDNPLEAEIAKQFKEDKSAFTKTAREWTKKHASGK
eukprot:TRINITY_DN15063_c0_g1_i1.p2 TRINITY_DN15063_c0_g1~~TRINITY_DN15063_c0_g1_i1.p2  ORF type:complete len:151 (-),score=39.09 TRINITY_DN15063_c0_g1_i1:287-739(-)